MKILLGVLLLAGGALAETVQVDFGDVVGGTNAVTGQTVDATYGSLINAGAFASGGGFFDATEPVFQGGGAAPVPDGVFSLFPFPGALFPLNFVAGFEEGSFTVTGLTPNQNYLVEITISDLDDTGLFLNPGLTTPALEQVIITGNGGQIGIASAVAGGGMSQLIIAGGFLATANAGGMLTVGTNQIFVWDPSGFAFTLPPAFGSQTGIRVEQIKFTATPEPETILLVAVAALAAAAWRRRRCWA